jgi:lysophospholipase L1-like esterase
MAMNLRRLSTVGIIVAMNVLAIALILVVIEGYLSAIQYQLRPHSWIFQNEEFIQEGDYRSFFTLDADEIFIPRKNTVIVPDYWGTDEYGFRLNPAHSIRKDGAGILVIGDSYAYGHGVSDREAWPAVLEDQLNIGGIHALVYNAAVPATGTDQQFIRLRRLASQLHPKIVLWMISFNDMADSNLSCLFTERNGRYVQLPAIMNVAYVNAFATKLLPVWFVKTRIGNAMTTVSIRGRDLYTIGCSQDVSDEKLALTYFDKLKYLLMKTQSYGNEQGYQLLVLFAPAQTYLDQNFANTDYEIEFQQKFIDTFKASGVQYLHLDSEIARQHDPKLYAERTRREIAAGTGVPSVFGAITTGTGSGAPSNLNLRLFLNETVFNEYGGWHLNAEGNGVIAEIIYSALRPVFIQGDSSILDH